MNKIQKVLQKLDLKQQQVILLVMKQILRDFRKLPDVKALVGKTNWYRVRVGQYRILFEECENGSIHFHQLGKRNEKTYKNL